LRFKVWGGSEETGVSRGGENLDNVSVEKRFGFYFIEERIRGIW